jgi:hypothetical protein
MVQCPSAVYDAPMVKFHGVLVQFQLTDYPRNLIRIQATGNSDLEKETILAVPDLMLVLSSIPAPKITHTPFILETAFAQTAAAVFRKVENLVAGCPDVIMVVVVLINEKVPYRSPPEGSSAWQRFK